MVADGGFAIGLAIVGSLKFTLGAHKNCNPSVIAVSCTPSPLQNNVSDLTDSVTLSTTLTRTESVFRQPLSSN